jgi:sporulation protein YlmC with PRC-barrel domain
MENKIQLQKHAHVLASNAQEVGSLDRVVINPATKEITHIVVRMGALLSKEDKIVPIELVTDTTEDLVVLGTDAGTVESMPLFEEKQFVSEERRVEETPSKNKQPVSLGESSVVLSAVLDADETYATETVQNIPEGTVAMKEGAKVISADGEHIGNVERVLADSSIAQVTHLMISRGILTKEVKLIPMKWILKIGEDNVYLNENKDSVEGLAGIPLAE